MVFAGLRQALSDLVQGFIPPYRLEFPRSPWAYAAQGYSHALRHAEEPPLGATTGAGHQSWAHYCIRSPRRSVNADDVFTLDPCNEFAPAAAVKRAGEGDLVDGSGRTLTVG